MNDGKFNRIFNKKKFRDWNLKRVIWNRKQSRINDYSLVPNRHPPALINFFKIFPARTFLFQPPWKKFYSTQAFKICTRFVKIRIKKIVLKNQKSLLNLRKFSHIIPIAVLFRFWVFAQASWLFQHHPPSIRSQRAIII